MQSEKRGKGTREVKKKERKARKKEKENYDRKIESTRVCFGNATERKEKQMQ